MDHNNSTNGNGLHANGHHRNGSGGAAAPKARVLVIGLDGATFDLIKPWAAEGRLPTLARLMDGGAHGSLHSTIPPMTGPAWTTFATGVNPGKHDLYDWIAREAGTYHFLPTTALDCKTPTVYELLSQVGRSVCVMNVPMTFPPKPVNGVVVSGLPAPDLESGVTYRRRSWTRSGRTWATTFSTRTPARLTRTRASTPFSRLYRTTDLRVETLAYLRGRSDWDFAMVVFNGTDTISHAMWKFMDSSHPLHDPAKAKKYGNAIRDYYSYVDAKLAAIVDELDDDTTLIIMSDHGFGPFHKFIHVNNWLMDQDFMAVKPGALAALKHRMFRLGFSPMNVYNTLMALGLGSLKREVVRGQGQGLMKTLFLSFDDVDWSRTKAYSLGNVGQIRINVAGREPFGCVARGEEYEAVRDDIIARLYRMTDPKTGEQVVEQVYRREEIYAGPYLDDAPDIVFIPRRLEYFGFGEYEFGSHKIIEPMQRGISGTHRLNGIFIAYGARVRAGAATHDAHLVDLAPTILHLMDEAVADHMDGRVLTEALSATASRPIERRSYAPQADDAGDGDVGLSAADQAVIAARLRSLGYVG
ncbi:MAG: alkaline phosphatase family protein [Caldilineaceae bacterium]